MELPNADSVGYQQGQVILKPKDRNATDQKYCALGRVRKLIKHGCHLWILRKLLKYCSQSQVKSYFRCLRVCDLIY